MTINIYPNDNPDAAAKKYHEDTKWLSRPENENSKTTKEKEKHVLPTYKYSKLGKGDLYESIILGGVPSFIRYDEKNSKLVPHEKIEEETRILRPPSIEEYPYTPYEFESVEELCHYVEYAKKQTIDTLYKRNLVIVKLYNDQDENKQILIALDIMWTNFQDKFPTTHYLCVIGDNDSGKSTVGGTFEAIAYRCVNMTSPSAPNVFRALGTIEAGQSTIVLDESDRIDKSPDMMGILKTGYDHKKKIAKINTNILKQEWFWAYCLKVIIAEKSPSQYFARGVLDRTFQFTSYAGNPKADIKEIMDHQDNPNRKRLYAMLIEFRKLMLVYRLIHFKDPIPDIDINIHRRNKELCKPSIQLFYGSESQTEIEQTLEHFLKLKNERKSNSIENVLLPLIINLVSEEGNSISTGTLWNRITSEIEGTLVNEDEYHTLDYGNLYRNKITKLVCDKFGAESKRVHKGRALLFKPDKLQRILKSYGTEIKIKTTLKRDGSDGTIETTNTLNENHNTESVSNILESDKISRESEEELLENESIEEGEGVVTPIEPTQPTQPARPPHLYSCYYCKDFNTNNRDYYEHHGSREHFTKPMFPTKTEIEKYGLKAQGKEWEV